MMQCPSCNAELQKSDYEKLDLDMCPNCKGVWLAQNKLDAFIQLHIKYADFFPDDNHSLTPLSNPTNAIPLTLQACPQCSQPMKWFNYDLEANIHLYRCVQEE